MKRTDILGLSAFYHDSALCYIRGREVTAAMEEERFSRIKHDNSFPENTLNALKERFGLDTHKLKYVVFYEKPILKFERIISNLIGIAPGGFPFALKSLPLTLSKKLFISSIIRRNIEGDYKLLFVPHHISHAVAGFIPSHFDSAAFMINDAVGEWDTTTLGTIDKKSININEGIDYPHSLGMFYSAFTYFAGFRVNSGEYKFMGLAPYGRPLYRDIIKDNIIDIRDNGSYALNLDYFSYLHGSSMCGRKMENLLGLKIRKPNETITAQYADLAASVQSVLEEVLIKMARYLRQSTGEKNLVLGGGIALNCVANSRIISESGFENVFIQPASGDSGGAMGGGLYAARYIENRDLDNIQNYSYLGTSYTNREIENAIRQLNGVYESVKDPPVKAAELIEKGNIVGWFNGRMEYGPRALGSRSILADPGDSTMQKKLNLKIKFRESFRPFAPSVMEEYHNEYFEEEFYTPYMLTVSTLRKKYRNTDRHITHDFEILSKGIAEVPAVVHADFSSRVQTVSRKQNPSYYRILEAFRERTGVPMIINTSFNIRGQPIVESPGDAFRVFMKTDMDVLIIGSYILYKDKQTADRQSIRIDNVIED
ncbi:MAG: carbamoyltransferase C-terminal domain-containing protein [candidate division WOR-3 bacterium]|nr:carbamoyltransferase C-terminal domain-containing protein [candidate division WOR-3 bacterium]